MLGNILAFELRYWLRSWMVWIFLLVMSVLMFLAASTDKVTMGDSIGNTYRNAPFVIGNFYSFIGLTTLLMATAFVNSAAARDFSLNTYQIMFSTRLRPLDFVLGRFLGAALISVIPMLSVSIGFLVARWMPWIDAERWGPVVWKAHVNGILIFAVPNALIFGAILFAIAVLARNEIVSFVGALVLMIGYGIGDSLSQNIEYERIGALLDPFGIRTFSYVTKYWTVAEKNANAVSFTGTLLWNRLLWLAVALVIFAFAYTRFSFAERRSRSKAKSAPLPAAAPAPAPLPQVTISPNSWAKLRVSTRMHFLGTIRSTAFIVILVAAMMNCVLSMAFSASEGYGNSTFPVTYWIINVIASTLYMFLVVIITYYAGVLVWKDKDTRMDEIADSLPSSEWVSYLSRLIALVGVVLLIQLAALASGVVVQTALHYHRYEFDLYAKEMFLRHGSLFLFLAVLAFFIHVLSPNKYVGYFGYIVFMAANFFGWEPLNVSSNLVKFGFRPSVRYSDMYRDAPYARAWDWFTLYWLLFSMLLAVLTVMLWPRGKQASWSERWGNARLRFTARWRAAFAAVLVAFLAVGGWLYYNTKILNPLVGPKDMLHMQADYEKAYRPFASLPMPRVRGIKYAIDIFPAQRNMNLSAEAVIENPYDQPLGEMHFSLNRNYRTTIEIPGAALAQDDRRLHYQIYKFSRPLEPGEKRTMRITVKSDTRGFENELSNTDLLEDGTFFNNTVAPMTGYDPSREIGDPNDRKKYGLGEQQQMPVLERDCTKNCMETYVGGRSDWMGVETVISTSPDQIAVAPGSLVREWQEGGRRYFHYRLDHPSLGFYSFISARYEVAREDWNGIKLEVYYNRAHPWNVPRMMNSLKKSLDYFTKNFGPYAHKEARIIEFPRVARFAQAFPGTMPYSESIGFIANLNHPDDIDMVFYVVAHEMGHQWWAHQVIGANMQGATFLSETMAQYSALMVMEKEFGRDMMRKFLRYEMDRYLSSRGRERQKERPLLTVEAGQGYVHYRKGSLALYYLKEMIGEEAVNRALRKMVTRYGYAPAPYPVSWNLVDALREQTPPNLQYLLKDLIEDITIFSNRTTLATAEKLPDGKYQVTLEIETQKFKADAKGNETEVPLDDWIEVGAFLKPEKGKKYGKTLYRERVHLTNRKSTETFLVDQEPDQAGVDPFALLVDRVPDDNLRRVTLKALAASAKP